MSASTIITPFQARLTVAFAAEKGWCKFPARQLTEREIDAILVNRSKAACNARKDRKDRHAEMDQPRPAGV